jgi:flavin reductase (DIM6/NTAB) family NADH-FMN oxidoreductase RutF
MSATLLARGVAVPERRKMSEHSTQFVPDPQQSRAFRDALGCFATGVCVVTATCDRGPVGMTANSFSALSLDPPLVMWAPARASSRFSAFIEAGNFAIHVLSAEQEGLARHFARSGLDFALDGLGRNAEGVLTLPGVIARFDCQQQAVHDAGDHALIIGRVLRATRAAGAPLVFAQGRMQPLPAVSAV